MNIEVLEIEKAFLVGVDIGEFDCEESLLELKELCVTAGLKPEFTISQKRQNYDRATFIGSGKLEEIKQISEDYEINVLIFDDELSATQIKNIEDITEIRTIDRTMLILDIFSQRSLSKEGKLQIELAQQKYRLPRLSGIGADLSKIRAGVGARGPGETKLESDKRLIRNKINFLEKELEKLESRRDLRRNRRKKDNVITVSIAGYTNSGKSTLLNVLTGASVLSEDKLFATLDPTSRSLKLPDGRDVLLVDTVGLISRLPHHLVKAFKSTLEEISDSDIILHVIDISNPNMDKNIKVTEEIFKDLECLDVPIIKVYNKCDKVDKNIPNSNLNIDIQNDVIISAKNNIGFDGLLNAIEKNINKRSKKLSLLIPYDKTDLLSVIRKEGVIYTETYLDQGVAVDALVDSKVIYIFSDYEI